DRVFPETKDAIIDMIELFLGPVFIMASGNKQTAMLRQVAVAVNVEVRCVADAPAVPRRQAFKPYNEEILILEEVRWGRPIERNHLPPVAVVRALIQAGSTPGVVRLIGIRAQPDEHVDRAIEWPNQDIGDI